MVEYLLVSVQFYIKSQSFFHFVLHSIYFFSCLLQKTLESGFLPHYESLKLNHDNSYLIKSEDTVEDPLMSLQVYKNSKSFFILCYSSSSDFFFITKDAKI